MAGAQHLLNYLNATRLKGKTQGGGSGGLIGFVDRDYAGDKSDHKSRTGCVFTYNGGAILWISANLQVVAQSTCEAEYMAAATATKEEAIKTVGKSDISDRLKHIDVRYHLIKDDVAKKDVKIMYVQSAENSADFLCLCLERCLRKSTTGSRSYCKSKQPYQVVSNKQLALSHLMERGDAERSKSSQPGQCNYYWCRQKGITIVPDAYTRFVCFVSANQRRYSG
eukprot:228520-Chlamydomonas_euryale.AAC.1